MCGCAYLNENLFYDRMHFQAKLSHLSNRWNRVCKIWRSTTSSQTSKQTFPAVEDRIGFVKKKTIFTSHGPTNGSWQQHKKWEPFHSTLLFSHIFFSSHGRLFCTLTRDESEKSAVFFTCHRKQNENKKRKSEIEKNLWNITKIWWRWRREMYVNFKSIQCSHSIHKIGKSRLWDVRVWRKLKFSPVFRRGCLRIFPSVRALKWIQSFSSSRLNDFVWEEEQQTDLKSQFEKRLKTCYIHIGGGC